MNKPAIFGMAIPLIFLVEDGKNVLENRLADK